MSWIVGIATSGPSDVRPEKLHQFLPRPLHKISLPNLKILAGGIEATCRYGNLRVARAKTRSSGFVVCGLGIRRENDKCHFLSTQEWSAILSNPHPDLSSIEGHFIVCRWLDGVVEFYCDQLGQRTLYLSRIKGGHYFSTRIDWLAKMTRRSTINFSEIGSRWLTFNQITYESGIEGIRRMGPGGYARITRNSLHLENKDWTPNPDAPGNSEAFDSSFMAFCNPEMAGFDGVTLGLSGGLDSRFVLSALAANNVTPDAYVYGSGEEADVRIAKRVAERHGISLSHYDASIPSPDECVGLMKEYAGINCVYMPVTAVVKLRLREMLRQQKRVVIDGGFGELCRRQLLNRVLRFGMKALKSGNAEAIARYMAVPRPPIFTEPTNRLMQSGMKTELESTLAHMPSLEALGPENYVDLFSIRTRVPNWGLAEQARLDTLIVNYMPLVQPSLLHITMALPVSARANARLFRRFIRTHTPALAQLTLVQFGVTYPFRTGYASAWLWQHSKEKLGMGSRDTTRVRLLDAVRPFVMDTVASQSVRSFGAYNHEAIGRLVSDYYGGKRELAEALDWWLTFELWRQSICAAPGC